MKVGFIGAGAIAESILTGLLTKKEITPQGVTLINRVNTDRLQQLQEKFDLPQRSNLQQAILDSDVIILAVKPKDNNVVLEKWGSLFRTEQKIISVMAGVTTEHIERYCLGPVPVIRAMPNTSATIGQSATAICQGKWAEFADVQLAKRIFSSIGSVVIITEDLMDAVTGLSGSGPAYFYYMVESLEKAGVQAGLDPYTARNLTLQTIVGAAQMLLETRSEPTALRQEITSEGGTTKAGLDFLANHQFQEIVVKAVLSASKRAKELGKEFVK